MIMSWRIDWTTLNLVWLEFYISFLSLPLDIVFMLNNSVTQTLLKDMVETDTGSFVEKIGSPPTVWGLKRFSPVNCTFFWVQDSS